MAKRPNLNVDQRHHLARLVHLALQGSGVDQDQARLVLAAFFEDLSAWCEPDWFTLGYTGWRGADRAKVRADLTARRIEVGPLRLIVGFDPVKRTPRGGDLHAYEWGMEAPGVIVECLPAPWHLEELGHSAGPIRNGALVERVAAAPGPKAMLAHLHPASRGAAGTAAYATWRDLTVWKESAV
ncbi:hypothetical protein AB0K21_21840 [Streptosporangium sp. NPDC049248]|uniref:hypothetical protein n=1 Tax=Streptosporangium sp. NPDC049248 TaxID=3155651 RepID=UPI0034286985